jgi:L-alanine-DL-glutamate epimerase-like enolase superfamily enzyme
MRRVRLTRVSLSYADGMVLHTASSGEVATLDELRLVVEQDGAPLAMGATRLNIAYLSGLDPEQLLHICRDTAQALDWSLAWEHLPAALDRAFPALPAPARMLFEMAASDGAARVRGMPLAAFLGGKTARSVPTNQTLFRCDDAELLRRADAYWARGFRDLKLRVGFGRFADDLHRLHLLRGRFGPNALLSIDANGSWSEGETASHLAALAPLGLRYVEQPIPAGDWDAIARLTASSATPLMLDESLTDLASVERLTRMRPAPLAHLKLAKLGGLDRLMQAGRMLAAADIPVMVGQMNEGAVSTLAAAHAAVALESAFCELYGADGLAHDPAGTLRYGEGQLELPDGPGLGLLRHAADGLLLWEHTI